MKKFKILGVAIISSLVLSSVGVKAAERWNIIESNQKFVVDSRPVEINILNINDSNYIKAVDFAELLDIDISYDETSNIVTFDKSKPFSGVRNEHTVDSEVNDENHTINIEIPSLNGFMQYGPYDINTGDKIEYNIKGEGNVTFLYALFSDDKDWTPGLITPNPSDQLYRAITYVGNTLSEEFIATNDGTYYLYIVVTGDTKLENIKGTVTISK